MKNIIPLIVIGSLVACTIEKPDVMTQHERPNDVNSVSVFTGKSGGINILELGKNSPNRSSGLPVNALLWRAALDTTSTLPPDDIDVFSGSIVTEWFAPDDEPYRRLKLSVFVIGMELRSDAVQVRAYVQVKTADGKEWITAGLDEKH